MWAYHPYELFGSWVYCHSICKMYSGVNADRTLRDGLLFFVFIGDGLVPASADDGNEVTIAQFHLPLAAANLFDEFVSISTTQNHIGTECLNDDERDVCDP